MARIPSYVRDTNVVAADKWIGSDSQNDFQTKNFTAGDVAKFINTVGNESQLLRYKYSQYTPTVGVNRPDETISFVTGGAYQVAFNGINSFLLSQYALNQGGLSIIVSTWYTDPLIDSDVLITQCDDITQWAIYKWTSATQKTGETDFWEIGLTYISGNGSLTGEKDYFISLLQYASSGDKNEVSAQLTGSNSYTITHGLNKFPAVTVSLGTPSSPLQNVECEVTYINTNQVKLEFTNNFTGVAIFN